MIPKNIILGSASPRRKELLSALGVPFTVDARSGAPEVYPDKLPYQLVPQTIAEGKSLNFHRPLVQDEVLITADTIVFCPDHEPLGKPKDVNDAFRMLRKLSGKTHEVITGVCIRTLSQQELFSACTEVSFKNLTNSEISYYIENYAPFDKAGAYAIQEWIGIIGITKINGSYYNVVGLPVQMLYERLQKYLY